MNTGISIPPPSSFLDVSLLLLSIQYHISLYSPFIQFWTQLSLSYFPNRLNSLSCSRRLNEAIVSTRTCWPDACCFYLLLMKMKLALNGNDAIGTRHSWELSAAPLYCFRMWRHSLLAIADVSKHMGRTTVFYLLLSGDLIWFEAMTIFLYIMT